jgi:hypothetical protein
LRRPPLRRFHLAPTPPHPLQNHPATTNKLAQVTAKHPRKSMYRARAHSNPFNDPIYDVPPHPDDMDW